MGLERLFGVSGAALALTACSSGTAVEQPTSPAHSSIPSASSTRSPERIQVLKDTKNQKPGIKDVTLFYAPHEESIKARICFDAKNVPDVFRVISREKKPNPGWLVDKAYFTDQEIQKNGCVEKTPVINLGPKDKEVVYVNVGDSRIATYKDMQVYDFTTNDYQPEAKRLDNVTVKPPLKMRDF